MAEPSLDEALNKTLAAFANYKKLIQSIGSYGSERKKLLGLPFLMNRKEEKALPHPGTWEARVFEEIYGHPVDFGMN